MNTNILESAIKNKLNVLLKGVHGVGKTEVVKQLFTEAYGPMGENWLYFSASTMDPWVDFIGIPKECKDEQGTSYLELIRPKQLVVNDIKAIFLDELNRSHKKVRNALMELIQFKSINGVKLNNIEVIWAAINPDDDEEEYQVDKLDPAHLDRFEIHMDVPNRPSLRYFKATYGTRGKLAVKWWNNLNDKQKKCLSPRRLSYALSHMDNGVDVKNIFYDKSINTTSFLDFLNNGDPEEELKELLAGTDEELRAALLQNNTFHRLQKEIEKSDQLKRIATNLPKDVLISNLTSDKPSTLTKKLTTCIKEDVSSFDFVVEELNVQRNSLPKALTLAVDAYIKQQAVREGKIATFDINGQKWIASDMKVVLTGTLSNYTREQATSILTQLGVNVATNFSYSTTHVIKGKSTTLTATMKAAQQSKKTVILEEEDFINLFANYKKPENTSTFL